MNQGGTADSVVLFISEMPKAWYNLRADMKQRPEPVNGGLPVPWLVPTLTLTVKYIWLNALMSKNLSDVKSCAHTVHR